MSRPSILRQCLALVGKVQRLGPGMSCLPCNLYLLNCIKLVSTISPNMRYRETTGPNVLARITSCHLNAVPRKGHYCTGTGMFHCLYCTASLEKSQGWIRGRQIWRTRFFLGVAVRIFLGAAARICYKPAAGRIHAKEKNVRGPRSVFLPQARLEGFPTATARPKKHTSASLQAHFFARRGCTRFC